MEICAQFTIFKVTEKTFGLLCLWIRCQIAYWDYRVRGML